MDAAGVQVDSDTSGSGDTSRLDSFTADALRGPDAHFADESWSPLPGLSTECRVRVARDAGAVVGRWTLDSCGGTALSGCESLTQSSFAEPPGRLDFVDVDDGNMVVAWGQDTTTGRATDVAWLRRTGETLSLVRSVYDYVPPNRCRLFGAGTRGGESAVFFEDVTHSDDEGNGARYPVLRSNGVTWNLVATLERDRLFNSPQDVDFSDGLIAIRVAPSNRMLTVLNDGSYRFTEPAPPYERVRVHSLPSVVGERWVATGLLSASANGLFMSHLGDPSIRIRDVDAVGEVVADDTDIVWLEGSRLTEGIRLDGTTLWRAPWRPGPIDPGEARIVRPIEDVARVSPDVLNPGNAFLRMKLGGGHVLLRDGLATACYVVRLADGHMARFDPPGFTCSSVYHVSAEEIAVGMIEEGDLSFRSAQLWFVPLASLAFEP